MDRDGCVFMPAAESEECPATRRFRRKPNRNGCEAAAHLRELTDTSRDEDRTVDRELHLLMHGD